ncbi:7-cyano-7-deazaguanine synthase QueC [Clostridium formicaceticum]|uniref:7-cyano-7-deazaguanine synthase n=1 Tax=Clostridium formicaceticum TaxID=1497 RepID=A0AAC9RKN2_9CLOT|nr:7-cyano-7-deazaguanine synthase QueC [Clostridium formicaceticum]AOY74499.1 7-cyano-7-deazaguanine synthase QueC [Clostridium formicaceticum]ARE88849.1 7-cyano-7-deazaguanine synthase [Clostridium formicaceticum]
MKKAVVLLSGGLDSTTCMAVVKNEGYELYPISFNYNQRHKRELALAKKIAAYYGAEEHEIISMENVGGSALTDMSIDVPVYKGDHHIPITYVPARNILFLSYALGYAEVIGAEAIVIGVSAVDYSGYPDCRPEFIEAFQKIVDVGTAAGVEGKSIKIITPLIHLSKAETIKLGHQLQVPYHLTTSCYNGEEKACGVCDSCVLRLKGFEEAKLEDPIAYK